MVVSRLRLLLIGQCDCHTLKRVQNLLGVLVTHCVFRGAIQQLMGNFFCLVHDRRKGHIIVVANVVKQPFQLHHQARSVHLAAGRLLQLPGYTLHLGLGSMVPGLQFLAVKHLAQSNVHLVQPLVIPQQRGAPGVVNALGIQRTFTDFALRSGCISILPQHTLRQHIRKIPVDIIQQVGYTDIGTGSRCRNLRGFRTPSRFLFCIYSIQHINGL